MYYPALLPFLKHFPPCQIFIARTEDILVNPSSLFQKLATFLDIDPSFFSERNAYPQDEWTEEEIVAKQVDIPIPTTPTATPTTHTIHDRNSLSLQRSRHSNRFLPNPERIEPQHQHSLKTDQLPLSIRYRLERIFGLINDKLLELIDIEKTHFGTWEYDVERG
jgi:hypothetical protein